MIADLRTLVAIPTGHRHEPGLEETRSILIGRLTALGATPHRVSGDRAPDWLREGAVSAAPQRPPPFIVCRKERANARVRVLLCGHADTVHDPAGDFRELSIAPGGKTATGPGCVDMKGGLLVALAALRAIEEQDLPVSWTFAIVSDEETGSFHCDRALREEAARGYDAALVFEPALPDGGLVVERMGSGQFIIECGGKAAHVGRDFVHGVSAVHALAQTIDRAMRFADPARGLIVNIGPLEGGSATNVVPDSARAWGNVRVGSEAAYQSIREALAGMATVGGLPSTRVQLVFNRPPKPLTPAVQALADLARGVSEDLGRPLPFGRTGGVCDGNNIQASGVPTLDTLGVRGGGLHTTDEWIELDSLVERAQMTAVLLARLANR